MGAGMGIGLAYWTSGVLARFYGLAVDVRPEARVFLQSPMPTSPPSIQSAIQSRIQAPKMPRVWTPDDFADLGSRSAIDLALHRLV